LTTFGFALPCVSRITWPTKKPSRPFLAAPVGLHLLLVLAQDPVDHRVELGRVRDRALAQVLVRREALARACRNRRIEGRARDLVAFQQHLCELGDR
jgi:hypothetical protein